MEGLSVILSSFKNNCRNIFFVLLYDQKITDLKKSSRNIIIIRDPSKTYQRHIVDFMMPDRRPWHASAETSTCLIGDRHAWLENHRRPACLIGDPLETSTGFIGDQQACRYPMGLRWGMLVSDGSPTGHVGFRWVSDGTCWFQMGHQWSMLRSPMFFQSGMSVYDGACRSLMGLRSGMLVSDGVYQSPMKHVEVSDGSPIRQIVFFLH